MLLFRRLAATISPKDVMPDGLVDETADTFDALLRPKTWSMRCGMKENRVLRVLDVCLEALEVLEALEALEALDSRDGRRMECSILSACRRRRRLSRA